MAYKNKEDKAIWQRNHRAAFPDKWRAYDLKARYGISLEKYDLLFKEQNGVCKCCGKDCSTGKRLAVDHCHKTGEIRALLCFNCNTVIGKLEAEPKILKYVLAYYDIQK